MFLSVVVSVPRAVGWYLTDRQHLPELRPGRSRWGVGRYVEFIETWSSTTVVVGFISGIWLHTLAATRTDYTNLFMGFGALFGAAALVVRFMQRAMDLRRKYEEHVDASEDYTKLPPDPTLGMLGHRLWELPAVLGAAVGVAYKFLEAWGLTALMKP